MAIEEAYKKISIINSMQKNKDTNNNNTINSQNNESQPLDPIRRSINEFNKRSNSTLQNSNLGVSRGSSNQPFKRFGSNIDITSLFKEKEEEGQDVTGIPKVEYPNSISKLQFEFVPTPKLREIYDNFSNLKIQNRSNVIIIYYISQTNLLRAFQKKYKNLFLIKRKN